ncbi:MAG: CRISPR-associated protein Cas4 [Nitrososphaerota archaeon]
MEEEERYITLMHVKDYIFCPSTFYYKYILGIREPVTELMQDGIREFTKDSDRYEERKTLLARKRIRVDKMLFGVEVSSKKYMISGVVDTIYWSNNKLHVLEIKAAESRKLFPNHLYQTSIYALAVEDVFNQPVYKIAVFYKKSNTWFERRFTSQLRRYSINLVQRIHRALELREPPEPVMDKKCRSCFYRKFCHG